MRKLLSFAPNALKSDKNLIQTRRRRVLAYVEYLLMSMVFLLFSLSCDNDLTRIFKIETLPVTEISQSSCLARAEIIDIGEGTIEEHGFCWAVTPEPTISNERNLLGERSESGEFTQLISGLSESSDYYLRAYIQSGETVVYGDPVFFTTLAGNNQPPETTNTAPVIISVPETEAIVGQEYSYQLVAQDTNQGDVITYSVQSAPAGFTIDPETGVFSGVPGEELYGEHSITLRATDSESLFDEQSYSLNVSFGPDILYDPRDGNLYDIITLGDQAWMAQDLRYLPEVSPPSEGSQSSAYYYVYGYDGTNVGEAAASSNYLEYGVLYNWPAAMAGSGPSAGNPSGVQGVCPSGWHLPSDDEWKQLEVFLDMSPGDADGTEYRGTDQGSEMAGNAGSWNSGALVNDGAFGSSGLNILPSGGRYPTGNFDNLGKGVGIWSTSEFSSSEAWYRGLYFEDPRSYRLDREKDYGFSVRCVRD